MVVPRARIIEIAANDEIRLTGVAPAGWYLVDADAQTVQSLPVKSYRAWERFGMKVRVKELLGVLRKVESSRGVTVNHIYDY